MHHMWSSMKAEINRRSFVKNGLKAAGVATVGAGILGTSSTALAERDLRNTAAVLPRETLRF